MVKTDIVYLNEKNNIVSMDKAKWKVIHIYDKDGKLEKETWIDLEVGGFSNER